MMMISDWARFFFLSLKLLSYLMLNVEGGSEVIKALWLDTMVDLGAIPLLAVLRTLTEEKRQILIILFVVTAVSPACGEAIVQSYDRLRDDQPPEKMSFKQLACLCAITLTLIRAKLVLWKHGRRSGNATVRLCAKEDSGLIDVAGLVSAILYWRIDPIGATLVVACMTMKWRGRLYERNPGIELRDLMPDREVGNPGPPEFI